MIVGLGLSLILMSWLVLVASPVAGTELSGATIPEWARDSADVGPKLAMGVAPAGREPRTLAKPDALPRGRLIEGYGKLPLSFEANQGQTDSQVRFLARGRGYALYLTSTEAVLALTRPPARSSPAPHRRAPLDMPDVTGTVAPAVSDGWWVFIPPLAKGTYDLNFGGTTFGGSFTLDITYHITVE